MATLCQTEGCKNVPRSGHKWCRDCYQEWLKEKGKGCLICGNLFVTQNPRHFLCPRCRENLWDGSFPRTDELVDRVTALIEHFFANGSDLVVEDQAAALDSLEQGNVWRAAAHARRAELRMQFADLRKEVASQLDGHETIGRINASLKLAEIDVCFRVGRLSAAMGKLSWLQRQIELGRRSDRARLAAQELRSRLGTHSTKAREENARNAALILSGREEAGST